MIGAIPQRHRNEAAGAAPLAPVALHARLRCLLFAMALATVALAPSAGAQSPRERLPDASIVGAQVIEQTNALRSRHGLTAVEPDANLAEAAQKFAEFMARTERYGHEADARRPADRAAAEGFEHCMLAENIGYVFSSSGFTAEQLASRLVAGWWQSPGHRENMLLAPATHIGFGVARSERSTRYYAVQLLARPRSASTRFEVANRTDSPVRYEVDGETFNLAVKVTRTHTRCGDATLRILWPDDSEGTTGVRPRHGARYVLARDRSGRLSFQTN
jgi:uncharacterized protein YkwD